MFFVVRLAPNHWEVISRPGLKYERARECVLDGGEEANPVPEFSNVGWSPVLGGFHFGVVDVSARLVVQK